MSTEQFVVALSITEVEYIATTHASKEAVWLQQLCSKIGFGQQVVRLNCDSQSEIFLVKNLSYHSKTKHIDVQYHFIREMIEKGKVLIVKVDIVENIADLITRSVST